MSYNRKYKRRRKRRYVVNKFRFVRFIIILLIIIAAIIFGCVKLFGNGDNIVADVSPSPEVTLAPSLSPDASAQPDTSPTAAPDSSAEPSSSSDADTTAEPSPTPEQSQQGDLLKSVKVADGVKTAYLTFDDGPTKSVTPLVLDVLRKYNVKATFFQLGKLIEANSDIAYRVYEEGHLLANHSYAHEYSELYASEDAFIAEIEKTQALITDIVGNDEIKLFRFPGGSYNAGSYGEKKQTYKKALEAKGYFWCDWNALSKDAEGAKKDAAELLECVKETVGTQEDVVILMHDANGKKATAEALGSVIEYLTEQGYEFRRLDNKK